MPHPVDVHVGKRLRMRRTILGLSQEAVARSIGITFQQIQKYERGVNRMSATRLYDFAKIMTVPVSFFFEGFEEEPLRVPATGRGFEESAAAPFEYGQIASRETLEMMRAFYRIKEHSVRKKVSELIKAVAEEQPLTGTDKDV